MMTATKPVDGFAQLGLSTPILETLSEIGYQTPSPIQAQIIPHVLQGKDVLGQAQTGTGKTAAFALPLLSQINPKKNKKPHVLVLAPTRELALQVCKAFKQYATKLPALQIVPIYGGQDYGQQLTGLRRGAHIVVGTPGRVMDHMKRGSLDVSQLKCLVLDEADEMLRMGFIDDVKWILERTPKKHQIALLSATMPTEIKTIADKYLKDPAHIKIKAKTTTATTIQQYYSVVQGNKQKVGSLKRILEVEEKQAAIVFVRTKANTIEVADKLCAFGHNAAALNGDIAQQQRERIISQLKSGKIDVLIATDVAARGLDVERITHVFNYDLPHDNETYVHRIGRTGRAGRSGRAIILLNASETRQLKQLERATKQPIAEYKMPSIKDINAIRINRFKQNITNTLAEQDVQLYRDILSTLKAEQEISELDMAAALAKLLHGSQSLLLDKAESIQSKKLSCYRIEVGHTHGAKPGNIVGAIANEAGLDRQQIGAIDIHRNYSLVDLPDKMPQKMIKILENVTVAGQKLNISYFAAANDRKERPRSKSANRKPDFKSKRKRGDKVRDKRR